MLQYIISQNCKTFAFVFRCVFSFRGGRSSSYPCVITGPLDLVYANIWLIIKELQSQFTHPEGFQVTTLKFQLILHRHNKNQISPTPCKTTSQTRSDEIRIKCEVLKSLLVLHIYQYCGVLWCQQLCIGSIKGTFL